MATIYHYPFIVKTNSDFNNFSRIPGNNTIIRYVFCNYCIRSDDNMVSYTKTRIYDCSPSYIDMITNICVYVLSVAIMVMG